MAEGRSGNKDISGEQRKGKCRRRVNCATDCKAGSWLREKEKKKDGGVPSIKYILT